MGAGGAGAGAGGAETGGGLGGGGGGSRRYEGGVVARTVATAAAADTSCETPDHSTGTRQVILYVIHNGIYFSIHMFKMTRY